MATYGTGGGGGGVLQRLGGWAARRSEPRLWISIAGAGCVMAVTGLLAIAGDEQAGDGGEAGSSALGIILFLAVVVGGFLLMQFFREAPAATAGVTAVVLGVPPLAYFLTFDENDVPPFSIEAVLLLSAVVWLVAYLAGPGRGRPLLLAAGLLFVWLFVIQVAEDPAESGISEPPIVNEDPFEEPFGDEDVSGDVEDDPSFDEEFSPSDEGGASPTTVGAISVLFGGGYLVASRLLDRRGYAGTATPFVVVGHIALPLGIAFLSEDLDVAGTGITFVIAGALVAWLGALSNRRFTTIVGAIEMLLGLYMVLGDAMEDSSATSFGTALFVLGAVVVAGAHLLHMVTGETPQTTPGPSGFPGGGERKRVTAFAGAPGAVAGGPPTGAFASGPYAPGPYTPGPASAATGPQAGAPAGAPWPQPGPSPAQGPPLQQPGVPPAPHAGAPQGPPASHPEQTQGLPPLQRPPGPPPPPPPPPAGDQGS